MLDDKEHILKVFGNKLQKLRESKGLTQMDVAVAIGSYPNYISRLENGKAEPGLVIIRALVIALDCSATDLIEK